MIAVLLVFALLFWGSRGKARARAQRISCVGNLRLVGMAFRLYATDHGDHFPMALAGQRSGGANWAAEACRYFGALSNGLGLPRPLICPADKRKPATNFASLTIQNVSYFLGLDGDESRPQMMLAGDRNLTTNGVPVGPGVVEISGQSALGWTKEMHDGVGNVLLSDGSVQQVTGPRLSEMRTNWPEVYRLAVP